MAATKIEWATDVWNPCTGCTPISAGCANCYAKRMASRLKGRFGYPAGKPFKVTLHPEKLDEPLRWKKPRRVFVCSMGDLFHEDVPDGFISQVFGVMSLAWEHTFIVLTKRPQRMAEWLRTACEKVHDASRPIAEIIQCRSHSRNLWPLPNLWLGTTAENQTAYEDRIEWLLKCPATVTFLSLEPLLGPIDLTATYATHDGLRGRIHWLIAGPETGPRARPCNPDWIGSAINQAKAAGIKVFVKAFPLKDRVSKDPESWPGWANLQELPK